MKRFVCFLTVFLFFIWILPLGVFIKASQEKVACNGKRAICLCSNLLTKAQAKWVGKILLKSGSGVVKENTASAGGANQDFFIAHFNQKEILQNTDVLQQKSFLYTCRFFQSIDHVPKA